MDQRGEIVIDHVFDDGTGFHEGLAAVRVGKSWGFIDTSGKFAIEPTLYNWCHFQEGLAAICWRGGKWGLIDREGKFTIQPKYSYLGGFNEGLALFKVGEKSSRYGFIDRQGREVIGATFKEGGRFSEGLAAVVLGNLWGYITPTGAFKIAPRFEGSRVTPRGTRHTDAGYFSNGLAPVWSGKGYGFIDTTGAFVSRDDFEMAHSFHEERALIQQEGRFGFVGPNGTVSIKPRFTYGLYFSNGLAAVAETLNGPIGFIDKSGEMILGPRFSNAMSFEDGLCLVETEKTIGYVNKAGEYVWEAPYVQYRSIGL